MDHATHARLNPDELTQNYLTGAPVYGPGDEKIGGIAHMHGHGADAVAVVDVGGFLGTGAKPVALPVSQLEFMRDDAGAVHALSRWSKHELKGMRAHRG
ncbi:MAG: PRC-barrel domain containing protein [Paracoccus sp. (in: a-proteobacteria)]|uniref:PRC-barrel domain containing protein n=1 Tax=Paracoccus sp. TaxID=267 RepID=UPI0039E71B77